MPPTNDPLLGAMAIGVAGITTSLHTLRVMANRGVASPEDVEDVYNSILEHLEEWAPKELTAIVTSNLDQILPSIREAARTNWKE